MALKRELIALIVAISSISFPMSYRAIGQSAGAIDIGKLQLTFDEEFDELSVSPWGPNTRWIAHTPWAGDFGDAAGLEVDRTRLLGGLKDYFKLHGIAANWEAIEQTPDEFRDFIIGPQTVFPWRRWVQACDRISVAAPKLRHLAGPPRLVKYQRYVPRQIRAFVI